MKSSGSMGKKRSTCLYLDTRVVETAKEIGLNVSRVSENALIEAIEKLRGPKPEAGPKSPSPSSVEGRGRDLNPGARLHRPVGYQATSPRPHFSPLGATCAV